MSEFKNYDDLSEGEKLLVSQCVYCVIDIEKHKHDGIVGGLVFFACTMFISFVCGFDFWWRGKIPTDIPSFINNFTVVAISTSVVVGIILHFNNHKRNERTMASIKAYMAGSPWCKKFVQSWIAGSKHVRRLHNGKSKETKNHDDPNWDHAS